MDDVASDDWQAPWAGGSKQRRDGCLGWAAGWVAAAPRPSANAPPDLGLGEHYFGGRACQILLASSKDAIQLKKRAFKINEGSKHMMMWRAISGRSYWVAGAPVAWACTLRPERGSLRRLSRRSAVPVTR